MIERRARDRGADAANRALLWKMLGAAVLATGAVFWLIHASGVLDRP